MQEQEGVIKFNLHHRTQAVIEQSNIIELDSWRNIFHRLELIGQTPSRYHGYGFGNISVRHPNRSNHFYISGTQTGKPANLAAKDYALVESCDINANEIHSAGLTKPSSEAMTHAQIYQLDQSANAVIHVHSPDLWKLSSQLGILTTAANIEYGTIAMTQAVENLFQNENLSSKRIFSMGGHEDGIVSFGANLREASEILIANLAETNRYTKN